jgi:uncharacterized membrane protein YczE
MNIYKRILLYIFGIFIVSLGINISKLSGLGITPVSSVAYSIELITAIKLGTISIIVNIIFIALQAVILGKDFKISSCLQFFCTFLLGFFINMTAPGSVFLSVIPTPESYIYRLFLSFASCLFLGTGIYIYISTKLPALPGEGLTLAITQKLNGRAEFHTVKVIGDVTMVLISAILSLIFLGSLKSVREGTIISALLVGMIIGLIKKIHSQIKKSSNIETTVEAKIQ